MPAADLAMSLAFFPPLGYNQVMLQFPSVSTGHTRSRHQVRCPTRIEDLGSFIQTWTYCEVADWLDVVAIFEYLLGREISKGRKDLPPFEIYSELSLAARKRAENLGFDLKLEMARLKLANTFALIRHGRRLVNLEFRD